jgi:hypothetical protein
MPNVLPNPIETYNKLFKAIKAANKVFFKANAWIDYETEWFAPALPVCTAVELRGNIFLAINECNVYMLLWAINYLAVPHTIEAVVYSPLNNNNKNGVKKLNKVLTELNKVI